MKSRQRQYAAIKLQNTSLKPKVSTILLGAWNLGLGI